MRVPGHTQRVTFFLWGIPKESYSSDVEEEELEVRDELDRDAWINVKDRDDWPELDRIAFSAYNHGSLRVILTKHKAYFVGSVLEDELEPEARAIQGEYFRSDMN
jgi:hypothetical protein